jgi:hypothetical protein
MESNLSAFLERYIKKKGGIDPPRISYQHLHIKIKSPIIMDIEEFSDRARTLSLISKIWDGYSDSDYLSSAEEEESPEGSIHEDPETGVSLVATVEPITEYPRDPEPAPSEDSGHDDDAVSEESDDELSFLKPPRGSEFRPMGDSGVDDPRRLNRRPSGLGSKETDIDSDPPAAMGSRGDVHGMARRKGTQEDIVEEGQRLSEILETFLSKSRVQGGPIPEYDRKDRKFEKVEEANEFVDKSLPSWNHCWLIILMLRGRLNKLGWQNEDEEARAAEASRIQRLMHETMRRYKVAEARFTSYSYGNGIKDPEFEERLRLDVAYLHQCHGVLATQLERANYSIFDDQVVGNMMEEIKQRRQDATEEVVRELRRQLREEKHRREKREMQDEAIARNAREERVFKIERSRLYGELKKTDYIWTQVDLMEEIDALEDARGRVWWKFVKKLDGLSDSEREEMRLHRMLKTRRGRMIKGNTE